ncbi:hypothetical protein M569_08779, partial [Genlisea aurea]
PMERIQRAVDANAVVVFSVSTCCMCLSVKTLFFGMGVNAAVYEIDQDPDGDQIHTALCALLAAAFGVHAVVPVVFVGGKLVGAVDRVLAAHITGNLVPLLKEAGALWL